MAGDKRRKAGLQRCLKWAAQQNARIQFGYNPRTNEPAVEVYVRRLHTNWGQGRDHLQLLVDLINKLMEQE